MLCCHVEAVSGRVTGSAHWVTMMARSFRGFYETGKGHGESQDLQLKECSHGKWANWKFSKNQGHEVNLQGMRCSESQS